MFRDIQVELKFPFRIYLRLYCIAQISARKLIRTLAFPSALDNILDVNACRCLIHQRKPAYLFRAF